MHPAEFSSQEPVRLERTDVAQGGFSEAVFLEQQAAARKAEAQAERERSSDAYCAQRRAGLIAPFEEPHSDAFKAPEVLFYNGQTARDNGYASGLFDGRAEMRNALRVLLVMAEGKEPYGDIVQFIKEVSA